MGNTYTQIYIQTVFAVSERQSLISDSFKEDLYKYISGIVRNENQQLIAVGGMPDHIHILLGLKPDIAVSPLVREIKPASSNFVNSKGWVKGRFSWQEGFGAFSYSLIRNWAQSRDTSETNKLITRGDRSKKNTSRFCGSSTSPLMRSISSNGLKLDNGLINGSLLRSC